MAASDIPVCKGNPVDETWKDKQCYWFFDLYVDISAPPPSSSDVIRVESTELAVSVTDSKGSREFGKRYDINDIDHYVDLVPGRTIELNLILMPLRDFLQQ
jgi:hypothetical protein